MKFLFVSCWILLIFVFNILGQNIMSLFELVDWSLLGWSFAGSSAYIVWETVKEKPVQRTLSQKAGLIFLGMIVSMAASGQVIKLSGWEPSLITMALGAGGFKLFSMWQRKASKADTLLSDIENKET